MAAGPGFNNFSLPGLRGSLTILDLKLISLLSCEKGYIYSNDVGSVVEAG